jgi:hypothetical protein
MGNVNDAVTVVVAAAATVILYFRHREIAEAIEVFKNNFPRGGPPTPMHPSPAGDDSFLRPNSSKKKPNRLTAK